MLKPRAYLAHVKHETLDALASDPRLSYGTMALISIICAAILAWPGETLSAPQFRVLYGWLDDKSLMLLMLLHAAGMLRAIFKLKERPAVDKWAKRLGFVIFGGLGATFDLSLETVTLGSGVAFGIAALAFWLMMTKNRAPAGVTR